MLTAMPPIRPRKRLIPLLRALDHARQAERDFYDTTPTPREPEKRACMDAWCEQEWWFGKYASSITGTMESIYCPTQEPHNA